MNSVENKKEKESRVEDQECCLLYTSDAADEHRDV